MGRQTTEASAKGITAAIFAGLFGIPLLLHTLASLLA